MTLWRHTMASIKNGSDIQRMFFSYYTLYYYKSFQQFFSCPRLFQVRATYFYSYYDVTTTTRLQWTTVMWQLHTNPIVQNPEHIIFIKNKKGRNFQISQIFVKFRGKFISRIDDFQNFAGIWFHLFWQVLLLLL